MPKPTRHRPVMLRETLQALELAPGLLVVDGTVGAAGHSQKIVEKIRPGGKLLGLDRDQEMLARAAETLTGEPHGPAARYQIGEDALLRHAPHSELEAVLQDEGFPLADRILVDLGLSSDQLESDERGFGFRTEGLLDMRFDKTTGQPVADWLGEASVAEITTVLSEYGEEPLAGQLAEEMSSRARRGQLRTADQLRELIEEVYQKQGHRLGSSHPATRTFQALRIAVNAELEHVQRFLTEVAPACLKPGGLLAVISFHSLEDRLTKNAFQNRDLWSSASRKPIGPSSLECKMNPRSRSAKLRIGIRAD